MPSNSYSKIQIFNAALTPTRTPTVIAGDGSPQWLLLESNYAMIVEAALERGKYSFGRERVAMTSRVAGKFGYNDGYVLPADCLIVRHVWVNEALTENWDADATTIYLDATSGVEVEYVKTNAEQAFSRQFDLGITYKLEALILRWKEEHAEAENMDQKADFELLRAKGLSTGQRGRQKPYREGRVMQARKYGRF